MAKAPAAAAAPKFPKSMGACADRLFEIRDRKREAQKVVDALEEEYNLLKDHIINTMSKDDTGAAGRKATVKVVVKEIPQVKDYEAFYGFVKKKNRFDLLQKRLNLPAVGELMDAGVKVPGVEIFNAVSISLNKL